VIHADVAALAGRRTALRGRHQQINAAIALGVLDVVDRRGFPVTDAAKTAAIERAEWPGRIDRRELPGGRALLMDAAHNSAGAAALAAYLRDEALRPPLVFAAMRDKDLDGMFRALLPAVGSAVFTRATNPRSADPMLLADRARAVAPSLRITVEPDLGTALERAWTDAPLVLAAGSIFLLGDVMQHLGLHW
jgi:dihydrofolate synthase/folylpolyglutamate synthase